MRIYDGVYEAVREVERELFEMGIISHPDTYQDVVVKDDPDFETRELIAYCFMVSNPEKGVREVIKEFGLVEMYLVQEFMDRTSSEPLNPGNSWRHRSEVWSEFLHDGKFSYTYSERLHGQVDQVIDLLKRHPESRQAITSIYQAYLDNGRRGGQQRVPCSMYYQFLMRTIQGRRQLNLIYTMRSCDFYTHFLYDVLLATMMQKWVASDLRVPVGDFTFFAGSLHAFKKDWKSRPSIF